MVEMQVREQDMKWPLVAAVQREPQCTDACSSVKHEQRIVGETDLEAGGVAIVSGPGVAKEPRQPQTIVFK